MKTEHRRNLRPILEGYKPTYCEATGDVTDDLVACHINAGCHITNWAEPWNIIFQQKSFHDLQHNNGWSEYFRVVPHMRVVVERARRIDKCNQQFRQRVWRAIAEGKI